jgi:hypothetical protein
MAFPRIGTLLQFGSAPPVSFGWATGDDTFGEGTGQDITADWPANMDTEDLVVAAVATDFEIEWNTPTGFTSFGGTTQSFGARIRWWWRRIDGSEGPTFTIDAVETVNRHRAWRVIRIPGAHATSAPESVAGVFGSTSTPNPGSISPSWGTGSDSLILVAGCVRGGTTNPMVTAFSTNYENGIEHGNYVGGANKVLVMESRIVNATSEDPGALTLAESRSTAFDTAAIRAA